MEKIGHIYIYGTITSWQDDESSRWGEVNIKDIQNQIKNIGEVDEYHIHINSNGGEVYEGFGIHDFLSSISKKTVCVIEGMCASIATVIAMGVDEVKMTSASTFMIHNPFTFGGGDSEDLRKQADELSRIENKIVEIYQKKSNLSKGEILSYMKEESFFDVDKAIEFGFVDEEITTIKAVAQINNNRDMKQEQINELKQKLASSESLLTKLKNLFSPPKNLILQDTAGTEIDFYELSEGDEIEVGSKARVDGNNAAGEYVMPSGETYVFDDGALTEIKPDEDDDVEALKAEIEELKGNLSEAENSLTTEKQNVVDLKKSYKEEVEKLETEITAIKGLVESSTPTPPATTPPITNQGGEIRRSRKIKNS